MQEQYEGANVGVDLPGLSPQAAAAETVALPVSEMMDALRMPGSLTPDEGPGVVIPVSDKPIYDGEAAERTEGPMYSEPEPKNTTHPIFWKGRDINGNEFRGYAMGTREAAEDATALGSATCHCKPNRDYIPPEPVKETLVGEYPEAVERIAKETLSAAGNKFYRAGWEDADAAYQDLKTLVLAWATEEFSKGRIQGGGDEPPMVVYARNNR